jgi:hypothetical protein
VPRIGNGAGLSGISSWALASSAILQ